MAPGTGARYRLVWRADERAGRAWIELLDDSALGEGYVQRLELPPLRFDAGRGEIRFERGERSLLCARVLTGGWGPFRQPRIEPTGACRLEAEPVFQRFDNGFTVVRDPGERLVLRLAWGGPAH